MKTIHKIALARLAYKATHFARGLIGKQDRCIVTRRGLTFDLDLREGIDFAIYIAFFERQTHHAISRFTEPSATVMDIGANIGAHTLHLAQCVGPAGRVLAFEPTSFAFRKLSRNIALNSALEARIDAHHCFLAANDDAPVPTTIYSSWPLAHARNENVTASDIHAKHLGQVKPTGIAPARSIDSLLSEAKTKPVQFVKLDVDGFECEVLRGAEVLLREFRPTFVMEIAPYLLEERGASLAELVDMFKQHDYKFYDERTNRLLSRSAAEISLTMKDGASINVVARAD